MTASKIFCGQRVLGFICNDIPLEIRYIEKSKENLLITVVGNSFHTYDSKLSLLSISDIHASAITCIGVDAYLVFTACSGKIQAWKRGTEVVHVYKTDGSPIKLLLPYDQHLISVNENSLLQVWDINSEEIHLDIQFQNANFEITTVLHPITYLNKILLGSRQGSMQLWNIKSNKLVYTFKGFESEITVLQQAPAVDVVAVGHADGIIILHNLKFDETIMTLKQEWGPITSLTFRCDGHPNLAAGSFHGHIGIWDLEEKKMVSQIRSAHRKAVHGLKFLPNEPVLVSSSADNTIKMWIFDLPDDSGRLLRYREGHSAPPNRIRFHGNNGKNIISAGQDSTLRKFSTVKDHLNKNMGQASFNRKAAKRKSVRLDPKKMPPVTDFTSETTREKEWDNIAACHRGLATVTTWSFERSKMGDLKLCHDRFKTEFSSAIAQCVHLSTCGNFVFIGYDSGHVDKYNIQSGIYRGSFGSSKAHDGAVRGIVCDDLSMVLVTGGADFKIKFWQLKSCSFIQEILVDSPLVQLVIHKESGMIAASLEDFTILVIDLEMKNVVRTFSGHLSRVTDMVFSPDSKWLISSSMDCAVRVWDLPSAKLVDHFLVSSPCTSITISPTAEYLATTHVDSLGIHLWSNKTLYNHVSLTPLSEDYEPRTIELVSTFDVDSGKVDENEIVYGQSLYKSPIQLSKELITLSLLPNSRWKNILNLDIIKKRNKPKEPPKVPKSAPFFIPTIPDLNFKFDLTTEQKQDEDKLKLDSLIPLSAFQKKLLSCQKADDYLAVMEEMKKIGTSAIEIEIRSLSTEGGGSPALLKQFIALLCHSLETNRDFELVQAYCGLFLKIHADVLSSNNEFVEELKKFLDLHKRSWSSIQEKFNKTMCIVNYLKSSALS